MQLSETRFVKIEGTNVSASVTTAASGFCSSTSAQGSRASGVAADFVGGADSEEEGRGEMGTENPRVLEARNPK